MALFIALQWPPPHAGCPCRNRILKRSDVVEAIECVKMRPNSSSDRRFEVQIWANDVARGVLRSEAKYVEAIEGAEYEVRIRNPLPFRVAVAWRSMAFKYHRRTSHDC